MKPIAGWAGYCDAGQGHDKVWAAAVLDDGRYVCVHGRRGARLSRTGSKAFSSAALARSHFEAKKAEKQAEGYVEVEFGVTTLLPDPALRPWFSGRTGSPIGFVTYRACCADRCHQLRQPSGRR